MFPAVLGNSDFILNLGYSDIFFPIAWGSVMNFTLWFRLR